MAEALAALGLVGSVVQIVDFSQRFLRRLKEYQEKTNKLPATFQAIELQLPLIISGLKVVEARAERGELPDDSFQLIQPMLEACRKEVEKLDKIFSHLSLPSNLPFLNRGARAMRTLRYDQDVQQSATILKNHVEMLMLYQINTASVGISRLLLQDRSHETDDPELPIEESNEKGTELILSPLQERNDNARVWEKYLRLDRCTCSRGPVIQRSTEWTIWSANFSSQVLSMHKPGCHYFLERRNLWKLSFNLKYTSLVLRNRLQVAISMQFGNGIIEIDPKLDLRGVRRSNSPAFALIEEYFDPEDPWIPLDFDRFGLQIRRLFETGQACPFELDAYGQTLINAAYMNLFCDIRISNEDFHPRLEVLKTLHHFGAPLNEREYIGRTILEDAVTGLTADGLESSLLSTLIQYLIDIGAEGYDFDLFPMSKARMKTLIKIMRNSPDIAEYLNCNVLQFALLRRLFSTVEKVIRERPGLVTQQNSLGQNSLHLASDWPEATKSLLSTDTESLHRPDGLGLHPISYACMFKSIETVKLLLANRCPLLSGPTNEHWNSAVNICEGYFCRDIFELVASALAQRRLELLRIARQVFSERTLREIIPQEETVPDVSCRRLFGALIDAAPPGTDLEQEIKLNQYSREEYKSVYHNWAGPAEGAQILFDAGFRTVLGQDDHGRNPFHSPRIIWDITLVDWYYKKDVPFAKIEDFPTSKGIPNTNPNVQWLILRVSKYLYDAVESWLYWTYDEQSNTFNGDFMEAIRILLSGEFAYCVDKCGCPCSLAGCDSVTILLKQLDSHQRHNYYYSSRHRLARLLKFVKCVLVIREGTPDWNRAGPIGRSFVRFMLYEILGLRHICCNTNQWYQYSEDFLPRFSEEEVDEIIDEDRTLRESFESLLPLALSEWEHTSKPWTRFWYDFYLDNIASDTHDLDNMDENHRKKVTALGVRIEEEQQTGHQCTFVCYFEQPAEDDGGDEKQDEQSADLASLDRLGVRREANFPTEDSRIVCP